MSKKLTTEEFIGKARKVHCDKYDYTKVNYVNNRTKVCIICPEHGEFWQTPTAHLNEQGCPECAKLKRNNKSKKNEKVFINELINIFDDKYDYSKVKYINNHTKVCIICPEHGEFFTKPLDLLNGHGCPKCVGRYRTNKEFVQKAQQVHGIKYDYSKVNYINSHTKVCIICPEHGEFWQTPHLHFSGRGCMKCYRERSSLIQKLSTEEFIEKAKQIHGDKYDYSKVNYTHSREKVCIICHKKNKKGVEHGEFWQIPHDHLQNAGCPKCGCSVSQNEDEICYFIKNILNVNKIKNRDRKIITPLELDIYLLDYKLAIEYNGLLWHSEKYGKDKHYHLNKTLECEKNGVKLIQIFEDEYLEHKDIVFSKIRHLLKKDNDLPKVFARKCIVREIDKDISRDFLNKNHIQGLSSSTVYLGCFYNGELIGVMSFKKEIKNENNHNWELTRFATDIKKHCIGVGGKLFSYFIRKYNPLYIKSFADRRWTLDKDNNLYTKLGFTLEKILKPDYRYVNGYKREHKFGYRKHTLIKKYPEAGLTKDMTEYEMTEKLGFYRIWDCGLFKYVWVNNF